MSMINTIKQTLGERYCFEQFLSEQKILRRMQSGRTDFVDTVAASLVAGCVKIDLVLFMTAGAITAGYDVFVKDTPDSTEWLCYDNLPDPVCTDDQRSEAEMFAALERAVEKYGLSYTTCNFEVISGKKGRKREGV